MLTDKQVKAAKGRPEAYKLADQAGLYLVAVEDFVEWMVGYSSSHSRRFSTPTTHGLPDSRFTLKDRKVWCAAFSHLVSPVNSKSRMKTERACPMGHGGVLRGCHVGASGVQIIERVGNEQCRAVHHRPIEEALGIGDCEINVALPSGQPVIA